MRLSSVEVIRESGREATRANVVGIQIETGGGL
jgi:hypothetical protein